MKHIGKRTRKRLAMNQRLKKLCVSLGITSCELGLPGCLRDFAMSFAHSKKSRFLISDEDWMEAALCCCACHHKLDFGMGHSQMETLVKTAIANRPLAREPAPA